jgi:hypothetical protein
MPVVLNWLESWGAPLFASVVSIIYFRSSPRAQALWERVTVSAHGASIAALYFGAMSIWWAGASRSSFATPFALASVLPVALIVFSFYSFSRSAHSSLSPDRESSLLHLDAFCW